MLSQLSVSHSVYRSCVYDVSSGLAVWPPCSFWGCDETVSSHSGINRWFILNTDQRRIQDLGDGRCQSLKRGENLLGRFCPKLHDYIRNWNGGVYP